MSYGPNKYKETAILSANSEQILIMYYEAAIRHTKRAIECIENGDIPGKGVAIGKAHDIVNELANSLDFEKGGNIAAELDRLYNFMVDQFIKANINTDTSSLKTVLKMLETLLEGWRGALKTLSEERSGKQGV